MSGARYSIMPADALADPRITDLHLRLLAVCGSMSDRNGWSDIDDQTFFRSLP